MTELRKETAHHNGSSEALIFQNISKEIGAVSILKKVSFSVSFGDQLLLLGANGAGKSTLLRVAAGLTRSSSGTVTTSSFAPIDPRNVGYVGHQSMLYGELSVRENLLLFASLGGVSRSLVDEGLVRWELSYHADKRPAQLSKGLLAKASLCRAFFHKPRFLFLDEPSSALDQSGCRILIEEIDALRLHFKGESMLILATHDLARLSELANRIVILSAGELVHDSKNLTGEVAAVIQESTDVYLRHNR